MILTDKTVLVTGGTGFVGSRLVENLVLEQQAHVRVLVRNFSTASRLARFPVEMLAGDITDESAVHKAVQGCDFVFHCAHDARLGRDQQKFMAVQGTKNISEAVLQAGVRQMVHVSTVSVYGSTPDGDLTETVPWQPSDHSYIQAKRSAEQLVLDLHREKGLPVVVLQPTMIYGPYSKGWTLIPINDLKTGLVPLVNGGQGYCNPVYIDDVVDAMILAATQPGVQGEVFLISGKEPVSWKVFYNAFEAALGIQATVDISDERLIEMAKKTARRPGTMARFFRLARHPKVLSQVTSIPPVQGSLRILRKLLSEEQWQSLKSRVLPDGTNKPKQDGQSDPGPIHVPNETLLSIYRSRTWVRIDKAQEQLGYEPKFDFARGMEMTTQFIHWANLG
jgi:nucleoside-diphosphate-sugar epimerase